MFPANTGYRAIVFDAKVQQPVFFGIGQRHHVVHELIVNLRSGCPACKLNRQAFMVQQHKFTHIDTIP